METIEVAIKICLSVQLHQQIALLQQIRQIRSTDEAICTILQEYFGLMSSQITQDLIPFQPLWIHNVLHQQGVMLAQLQRTAFQFEQLIQIQGASALSESKSEQGFLDFAGCDNSWEAVELSTTKAEQGVTGTQLAKRIAVSCSTISRKRSQADFQHWTQIRDPFNIAWEYRASTCRFHPIRPGN